MNATLLKRWTAWLLPLLVLRAFIPVGFMLGSGPQGLQLMFCPGVLQATDGDSAVSDHDANAGSSHESQHGGSRAQHEHSPCPYGLVGAVANAEPLYIATGSITTDES